MRYKTFAAAAALTAAIYLLPGGSDAGQKKKAQPPVVATGILKGSPRALDEQNDMMRKYDLSTIPDNEALQRMIRGGYLVKMPVETRNYYLDDGLAVVRKYEKSDPPLSRRYTRPWVKTFVERFSSQYYPKCDSQLRINSLVRTWEDQARQPNGSRRSPHPSGSTVDIAVINMCPHGKSWVRRVLADMDRKGYVEATEERRPPHFHVMVYPKYADYVASITKKPAGQKKKRR